MTKKPTIDKETVVRIANLSHLEINESEIDSYIRDLNEIVSFVSKLQSLKTENVLPMTSSLSASSPKFREDIPSNQDLSEKILANCKKTKMGFFVVPKVVE